MSHMRPADQESWWPFARVLRDKGYQALAFDFRGYRDSLGELDIDSIDKDVEAALSFLGSRGASKVFLVGASMGGTASLKVAARLGCGRRGHTLCAAVDRGRERYGRLATSYPPPRCSSPHGKTASTPEARPCSSSESGDPKERHVVDGAAHGTDMLYGDSGPRAQGLILDFLRRYSE